MARKQNSYSKEYCSKSIDQNIELIQSFFIDDETLITRRFENQKNQMIKYAIFYIDGMVNKELINENVIKPLMANSLLNLDNTLLYHLKDQVILANLVDVATNTDQITKAIISGSTVLCVEGHQEALIISTNDAKERQIEEPVSEKVLRGPREGFTESLTTNLTLIRKKIQSTQLKFKYKQIGKNTNTKICVCYIDNIVSKPILTELNKRLDSMELDSLLDSNYIQEYIKDAPFSPFKTIGSTERPDVVAAKMLEGRIGIIVDGTPVTLTVPHLFIENIQSNEDYYLSFYYSTISRIIRILGFFITISIPAIYLSLISFHQEVIPTELLLSIYAARQAIPFPTIVELLALLFVFEILREAGTRMPTHIGQALSIVGALVLGQAAVEARFVSAPMVIVVGFSGITSLMIPKLTGATILIRTFLIFLSGLMGLYGYFFGISALLIHLFAIRSFGVPYMTKIGSLSLVEMKDTGIRAPWWYLQKKHKGYLKDNK